MGPSSKILRLNKIYKLNKIQDRLLTIKCSFEKLRYVSGTLDTLNVCVHAGITFVMNFTQGQMKSGF